MARHFTAASSDYIDLGTGVRGADVASMSVAAWVNVDDTASEHVIASRFDNTINEQWFLSIRSATVTFGILDNTFTGHSTSSSSTVTPGVWTHCGGSYDGTTIAAFYNGAEQNPVVLGVGMNENASVAVNIGRHPNSSAYMNGSICEVTFQLQTSNVIPLMAALAAGASPSDTEGISGNIDHIFYFPLLGESPEVNYTANGGSGTLHGTTAVNHPGIRSLTAFKADA